ncbi:hypothetical protein AAFF_G00269020 [Aldrovandia affinis]|uniref:Uncharacterized protein n=1 Tax=Aldrovandia affinis TaxID=143900 RepID=A0AAD7SSH5_9TELE|nr:hypothetical protein AAFF_G00269020 [Aldrovandia affinis]
MNLPKVKVPDPPETNESKRARLCTPPPLQQQERELSPRIVGGPADVITAHWGSATRTRAIRSQSYGNTRVPPAAFFTNAEPRLLLRSRHRHGHGLLLATVSLPNLSGQPRPLGGKRLN